MNEASKKVDAKLDGWLGNWPAPERDDGAWNDFDEKLEARLTGLTVGHGEDAWLDPPLPAEPGEGEGDKLEAGGARMSEPDSEQPKKKSLKDFAQRVSVAPPQSDAKPTGTPLPKANETPLPSSGRGSSPSLRGSGSFVSRPSEARDSDSGIVDLNAVRKSAISVPDTGTQPGESDLFDDEVKPAAPLPEKKASLMPIVGGGLVAVLAMAAAAVLLLRSPDKSFQTEEAPVAAMAASAAAPLATAAAPPPEPRGLTADGLKVAAEETPTGSDTAAAPAKGGPLETESSDEKDKSTTAKSDKSETAKPAEDPKTLAGAMATAVGAETTKTDEPPKSAPVVDPGSLPETPSQGAIAGAVGSVRDAARACVAGMDEPSRATITFASNGSVSSVSVGGAAAGKPAAGCIQAALKRARVSPFKKSSFSVGVTVRP